MDDTERMVEEYKELGANMRHYGNMRFAQLTLYFAFNAGLVAAVFTSDPPLSDGVRLVLKIVGAIAAFGFGVMEERAADYWHGFRRRAEALDDVLGYAQYRSREAKRLITATNAARSMVWGGVPLWCLVAILGK